MSTFMKSTYCSYYVAIQKQVSGIQSGFGYLRVSVLEIYFDPNQCPGRVRILNSNFGFRCPHTPLHTTPLDSNPTCCHPCCPAKTVAFVNHNQLAVSNFTPAHHTVLHRPWPNHTDTEKIHRLIISLPRRKWVFNTTSKSFERGSHHKTLPHVLPIGRRVWCSRLATNPRISGFKYGCHI